MTSDRSRLRDLLHRLSRLMAAEGWGEDLNPTQRAALAYLARANRFSRAPSHVADYLSATRGTVSQTLKALERKGLIRAAPSDGDRRSIAYAPTPEGAAIAGRGGAVDDALADLPAPTAAALANGLATLTRDVLARRGGRSFGMCRTCRHHDPRGPGGFCLLLGVDLDPPETRQLCHEHAEAA
jgi:DNA-binding MarR family transcriptional regulator